MENWANGITYEIAFWDSLYSNKNRLESLFNWSNYNKEITLTNFDVKTFLAQKENPIIIDAGCGMSFCNGDKLEGKPLDVRYIDPLAPFFNKIINKKKLDLPQITFGFIEYLSSFVKEKSSLIIVQNALDHSKDPLKGIIECIESLEIGGVLYLKHFKNEAETEHYRGFHQHNITIDNNEMLIWNKSSKIYINTLLKEFADTETSIFGDEIIAVITKKAQVPNEWIDAKKDISELANQYIQLVQKFNSASFSVSYHINFVKLRLIHSFIQLFSWKTRKKIKHLLGQK